MEAPHLNKRAEFETVLRNYQMSDRAKADLDGLSFALMVAPTATGRNTIINELLKTGKYQFIVTDTTRPPRINNGVMERDGVEYFFRTEDDMLADLKNGRFVEAAIIHGQQVSGISVRELERAKSLGKIAITDIEIHGTETIKRAQPNASAIFVLPPDFDEWMSRLYHRSPEMTPEEFKRRLASASTELQDALSRDYYLFVLNDTVTQAARDVDEIVRLKQIDPAKQAVGRDLAQRLLAETEAHYKAL